MFEPKDTFPVQSFQDYGIAGFQAKMCLNSLGTLNPVVGVQGGFHPTLDIDLAGL